MDALTIDRDKLKSIFDHLAVPHQMTGSRYICSPAPTDTDEDWIALDQWGRLRRALEAEGFRLNTDEALYENLPDFFAYRLGEFNVVVTEERAFYDRFVAATELAKVRNILGKPERIALFQSILYGA